MSSFKFQVPAKLIALDPKRNRLAGASESLGDDVIPAPPMRATPACTVVAGCRFDTPERLERTASRNKKNAAQRSRRPAVQKLGQNPRSAATSCGRLSALEIVACRTIFITCANGPRHTLICQSAGFVPKARTERCRREMGLAGAHLCRRMCRTTQPEGFPSRADSRAHVSQLMQQEGRSALRSHRDGRISD